MPSTAKRKVSLEVLRQIENMRMLMPSECRTELDYKRTYRPFEYGRIKIYGNRRKK
jgi:hypothetical protein